ncbi:MAG: S-layer homology domain-containing protein [Clostridia bacterium]|nr:S-layer homology domain-containing protein [Clostridia bacterium]
MKRDVLPNVNDAKRFESQMEFFFQTNVEPNIAADKQINIDLPKDKDLAEWFEVEADLTHAKWTDVITGFRFDPTNNNGIYYIDYIVFSKSENIQNAKWYDMYIDYAVENGIIGKTQFIESEYSRNIKRSEMCDMIALAIPDETYFAPINDVKGIPDVLRDSVNADIYLTLYKAGVLLGDEKGNFKPEADIKRSEIAAIINRVALPENRVKGTVNADWATQGNEYDIEFNDEAALSKVYFGRSKGELKDGALVLVPEDRGEMKPRFDPQVGVDNIAINAADFTKLRVRMKFDFIGENDKITRQGDFYFKTDADENLSETKSMHAEFSTKAYQDPFGWYIIDVDFATHNEWKGNITGFRFDPANTNGNYTIDYIRLVKADPLKNATHEELLAQGYTARNLMQDKGWDKGFYVGHFEQQPVDKEERKWQYNETTESPLWSIAPIWNTYDLWEHKVEGDKYVLADDKGINTLIYNPEEKSLSMRLNATKVYNGAPHDPNTYKWWPHLLLDQTRTTPVDREYNTVDVDRIYIELDMRVTDFKDTLNPEGSNNCSFLAYFYLMSDKNPNAFIWYGLRLFNGLGASTSRTPGWAPDSAAHLYMYGIPQADIFDGVENSFNPEKGKVVVSDEWKHIRLDITEHMDRCIEWANRDGAYGTGVKVSKEDMYFAGGNIGFEIHGNYDMTVEIKNVDIITYDKD